MKRVFLGLRVLLAGIFLYAGLAKASSSARFALALAPFTILPPTWIQPLSVLLPIVEILGAVLLLLPRTRRVGAALLFGLCLVFITTLSWALANDIIVSCGCFGEDDTPSAAKMVISLARDVGLAVLAVILFFEKTAVRPLSRTRDSSQKTPGSA